jgi:hypothetical protein
MREKLSEYLQGTLVDVTGKVVPHDGLVDTGDLRWFHAERARSSLDQRLLRDTCCSWALPTSGCLPELRPFPHCCRLPRCTQGELREPVRGDWKSEHERMDSADRNEWAEAQQPSQDHSIPGASTCVEIRGSEAECAVAEQGRHAARFDRAEPNGKFWPEINFRTVAAEARVVAAWLGYQKELRDRIMRSREKNDLECFSWLGRSMPEGFRAKNREW